MSFKLSSQSCFKKSVKQIFMLHLEDTKDYLCDFSVHWQLMLDYSFPIECQFFEAKCSKYKHNSYKFSQNVE